MKVLCNITLDFKNKEKTEKILRSIKVDDFDFVESKIIDSRLETKIESNSVSSLLHTLDDYLACISVAENIVEKK